jgi:FkbM family methyltransferase
MSRNKEILDRFSAALDKVEKTVPMRGEGAFGRIDPYIIDRDQFGHQFRIIIFHGESASWYGNQNSEWSLLRLREHNWMLPGDMVFDLGCNIGFNTIWYAKEVGPTGQVHSFDPYPWNTLAVQFNAELNGLSNIKTHTVGLADRNGILPISISDPRILNESPTEKFNAAIRPITDYAHLRPTFMKIDIEGAEYEVSFSNFRKLKTLRSIYLELHEPFIRDRQLNPRICIENFYRHGFDIHIEEPGGRKYRMGQAEDAGNYLYMSRRQQGLVEKLQASLAHRFNTGRMHFRRYF